MSSHDDSSKRDESERRIERIRRKLDLLSTVLNDLASRMKLMAEQQERDPDGAPSPDEAAAELLEILKKKAARAREISKKPLEFDESCGVPQYRYAQYVEFTDVTEFLRFRDLPPINREELDGLDWSDLERRLQE
jgi:hypothetical protein